MQRTRQGAGGLWQPYEYERRMMNGALMGSEARAVF
jgi:hypothetical protein